MADRRTFIRQLSSVAVSSAGRLTGLTTAFRRSLFAAGTAVTRELEVAAPDASARTRSPADERLAAPPVPTPEPVPAPDPSPPPLLDLAARASPSHVTTTADEAPTAPALDVAAALTPEQHTFLAGGARALLAVNDRTGAPHLSASVYHWDGAILRLPAQMFAARAEQVDRDPRVSAYIEDQASGAWVVITGVASIVYGPAVDDDLSLILAAFGADDPGAARWADVRSRGEAIVIRIRPIRFLWRPG